MTKRLLVAFVAVSLAGCGVSKPTTAVRVVTENPGSKCTAGGVSIQSGVDSNQSGTLDDDEVDTAQTRVICNGTNGSNGENGTADGGTNGLTALTRVTTEEPGANCEAGGSKIEVGLDADDDGTLSNEEVQSSSYVCNGTSGSTQKIIYGDVTLQTDADLGELAGVEVITGNLTVSQVSGGILTLPSLKMVGGTIRVSVSGGQGGGGEAPTPLTAMNLPNLERTTHLEIFSVDSLVTFTAPKLARVDSISISSNDALGTGLSFPLLTDAQSVRISFNQYLSTLSFASLAHVGTLEVSHNATLSSINAPQLRTATVLAISSNPALPGCEAYRLVIALTGELPYMSFDGNDDTVICAASDVCRSVTIVPFTMPLQQCFAQQTWVDALATCNGLSTGSSLLWFASEAEFTAVKTAILAGTLASSWVGYSDTATEGTFVAAQGNAFDPTTITGFWEAGEPNGNSLENYVMLTSAGEANDADAISTHAFICRSP